MADVTHSTSDSTTGSATPLGIIDGNEAQKQMESSANISSSQTPKKGSTSFFKIIVIGDSSVGKTCLTFRFVLTLFYDSSFL